MSREDNRIAERLRSVEGGDGGQPESSANGNGDETNIEEEMQSAERGGDGGDETDIDIGEREETDVDVGVNTEELGISERLEMANEYERRVAELREEAHEDTITALSKCFKQDVEVDIEPTGEGSLSGEVRIPRLKEELEKALDDGTGVEVEHIQITVGALSDGHTSP